MGSQLQSVDQTTMKAFSLLALVAAAYASDPYAPPAPYAPPVPAYAPAPVVHAVHAAPAYHAPVVHAAPAYHAPAPAYHADPYHEEKPKDYQFGYDVHGYDEYGNPNVHSRVEQRDGYNLKITSLVMMSMVMMNMETQMSTPELNREMDTMS